MRSKSFSPASKAIPTSCIQPRKARPPPRPQEFIAAPCLHLRPRSRNLQLSPQGLIAAPCLHIQPRRRCISVTPGLHFVCPGIRQPTFIDDMSLLPTPAFSRIRPSLEGAVTAREYHEEAATSHADLHRLPLRAHFPRYFSRLSTHLLSKKQTFF